ncbi:MAG: glycosyltransferase [Ignavibacteriae bacterium]|nr:glycosyltransferase [Ignavibacteriota bacterium]
MSSEITRKRPVLVIAYYFPPLGLSGVQRTLKFVKYLPQFGYQPTVLTVTPTGYFAQDESLLEELNGLDIEIFRVGSLDANRLFKKKGVVKMPSERMRKFLTFLSDSFFIPDNKIGWKNKALKAAIELHQKHKFNLVFATAPPFTDFLIGAELRKRFNLPLVIDYRDPWLEYPLKYYPTPLHRWLNYRMEKAVLRLSSRIIVTNRRVKELMIKKYRFLEYNDITILSQGFDPTDFEAVSESASPQKMRITHAGVFYGDRTPKYFLQALKRIFVERPSLKEKIEACFVGVLQDEHTKLIKQLGLESNIITTGYLNHESCIRQIMSSDILWLTVNNDRQSPGKLYEYIGARKPVLACVPDGFIRQTLQETGASIFAKPDNVEEIAQAILKFYQLYEQKKLPKPNEEIVQKYDRVKLTEELSRMFGFLVSE